MTPLRAVAALLLVLPLAGCLGPKPEVTLSVVEFAIQPLPVENRTAVHALLQVRVAGIELKDIDTNFWVKDAARNILLSSSQDRLNIPAGGSKVVNVTLEVNGLGTPYKFLAHSPKFQVEAWPPVGLNTQPFGTRLDTAVADWAFLGTFSTDRQNHHFVVDNTALGTTPSGAVKGTLAVKVNGAERLVRIADLAPGSFTAGIVVVRNGERVDVSWTGDRADVLVYVGDELFGQYQAAVGAKPAG